MLHASIIPGSNSSRGGFCSEGPTYVVLVCLVTMVKHILTSSLGYLDDIMLCWGCISCHRSRAPTAPHEASPGRLAEPPGGFAVRGNALEENTRMHTVCGARVGNTPQVAERALFRRYSDVLSAHGTRTELCGRIRGADGCARGWSSPRRRNRAEKRPAAGVVRESGLPNILHGVYLFLLYDTSSIRVYCYVPT